MIAVMMKEASGDFLIPSAKNLIIPRAIIVSRALDAASVDAAAPTEVYIHLARPRDELAGADCDLGGVASCGGALSGRAF